jgi:hypothetical protein
MFVTFYLPNSYSSLIGFFKMNWSTIYWDDNKTSLTRIRAHLNLQKWFPKQLTVLDFHANAWMFPSLEFSFIYPTLKLWISQTKPNIDIMFTAKLFIYCIPTMLTTVPWVDIARFGSWRGEKNAVSVGLKLKFSFQFRVPHFGALYLLNQAESDFGTLRKVGDLV